MWQTTQRGSRYFPTSMASVVYCTAFLLLLVFQHHATLVAAFGTKIGAGDRECLVESIAAGGTLAFTFRVVDGGSLDIDVVMYARTVGPLSSMEDTTRMHYSEMLMKMRDNATTAVVNEWRRVNDGSQSYTAPSVAETKHGLPAEVTVCFDNTFSLVSPKWLQFQFLKHDLLEIDPNSITKAEAEIEKKLYKHGTVLFELATTAEQLRQVGESDRVKHGSIAHIITAGLVGNLVILVVMAMYQYTALTRFLTRNGKR